MFIRSFKFAARGIGKMLKTERNFRVMLVCFLLVVAAGFLFGISGLEWVIVLFCSGSVLTLEMINTSIENLVDLATSNHHPLAEKAKDIAAGAVLIFSAVSLIVGLIVFLPYVIRLLSR